MSDEVHVGGFHFSPSIILKGLRMSGKDLRIDENEIMFMIERLDVIEKIVVNVRRKPSGGSCHTCRGC